MEKPIKKAGIQTLPNFYPEWMKQSQQKFDNDLSVYLGAITKNDYYDDILLLSLFPGRRIRPILYYSFWKHLKGNYPTGNEIYTPISIELFHAASIVVDDIVDEDIIRRNKTSLFKIYGEKVSIIISHLLVSIGYQALQKTNYRSELFELWNRAYQEAALGEIADVYRIKAYNLREQGKLSINKTVSFFKYIAECLCLYTGTSNNLISLFEKIGYLFQYSNDVHDYYYFIKNVRGSKTNGYRLGYSLFLSELLEKGIVNDSMIATLLTYEDMVDISKSIQKNLDTYENIIEEKVRLIMKDLKSSRIEGAYIDLSLEFFETLKNPLFWEHHHEYKK
jgi:hypothetical protein